MTYSFFKLGDFCLYKNYHYARVEQVFENGTYEIKLSDGALNMARDKELSTISIGRLSNVQDLLRKREDEVDFLSELEKYLAEEAITQRMQERHF